MPEAQVSLESSEPDTSESEASESQNSEQEALEPDEPGLRLVVGLGNPGERYRETRHNVGFRVVAELSRRLKLPPPRLECNALVAAGSDVLAVQPQTFMNRSGYSLRCLLESRELDAAQVLVVYDEVSLPLGRLRFRPKGGPGGHRGMESVIENLRTQEVPRLRCGIAGEDGAPGGEELVDFVLAPFEEEEREAVESLVLRAADACEVWLEAGAAEVMNRFNG